MSRMTNIERDAEITIKQVTNGFIVFDASGNRANISPMVFESIASLMHFVANHFTYDSSRSLQSQPNE